MTRAAHWFVQFSRSDLSFSRSSPPTPSTLTWSESGAPKARSTRRDTLLAVVSLFQTKFQMVGHDWCHSLVCALGFRLVCALSKCNHARLRCCCCVLLHAMHALQEPHRTWCGMLRPPFGLLPRFRRFQLPPLNSAASNDHDIVFTSGEAPIWVDGATELMKIRKMTVGSSNRSGRD